MKFLKSTVAAVLTFAMAIGVAGCSKPVEKPADKPAEKGTEAVQTFKIATDTTFAPFEFEDENGEFVGIDIDLLKAIAADQGFEIDVQALGFNAAVQALEAGQVDGVIAGMSITDKRKEQFDFSEPYFASGVVMGISADNIDIKSYEDLAGKKVATKTGTEGYLFAESIKDKYDFEMVTFDDSNAMYQEVMVGNSVACFEDYPVMGYAITQGVKLKLVTDMEAGNSYGFAVGKGKNAELLKMFNDGYKNIVESGKYQEILDTYIQK